MKNPEGKAERVRKAIQKRAERKQRQRAKKERWRQGKREYADRMSRLDHAIHKDET